MSNGFEGEKEERGRTEALIKGRNLLTEIGECETIASLQSCLAVVLSACIVVRCLVVFRVERGVVGRSRITATLGRYCAYSGPASRASVPRKPSAVLRILEKDERMGGSWKRMGGRGLGWSTLVALCREPRLVVRSSRALLASGRRTRILLSLPKQPRPSTASAHSLTHTHAKLTSSSRLSMVRSRFPPSSPMSSLTLPVSLSGSL
jgi:hypothetical protein